MGLIRTTRPQYQEYKQDQPSDNYVLKIVSETEPSFHVVSSREWSWGTLYTSRQWIGWRNTPWRWPQDYTAYAQHFVMYGATRNSPEVIQAKVYLFDQYVDVTSLSWATQPAFPTDAGQIITLDVTSHFDGGDPQYKYYSAWTPLCFQRAYYANGLPYDIYATCVDIVSEPTQPDPPGSYSSGYYAWLCPVHAEVYPLNCGRYCSR